MTKELWFAINTSTGETAEAMEPITLEQFSRETGFTPDMDNVLIERSRQRAAEVLNVDYV